MSGGGRLKAGLSIVVISLAALLSSFPAPAQEGSAACSCACSLARKSGPPIVVDTISGASCGPCTDACCESLCAPILRQELERRKAEKDAQEVQGYEMRANVQALLDFVLPQLQRGSGEIPFKALTDAMRVEQLGVPEDVVQGIAARGAIAFSGGKGENSGGKFRGDVPTKVGYLSINLAKTVSADVATTPDGRGVRLSRIKGLSFSLPIIRLPATAREISVSPDMIVVKYSVLFVPLMPLQIPLIRPEPHPKETP